MLTSHRESKNTRLKRSSHETLGSIPPANQSAAMKLHTYVSNNRNTSMPTMSKIRKLLAVLLVFSLASLYVTADSNAQWSSNVQLIVPMSADASASSSEIEEADAEAEESEGITISFENNDLVKEALDGLFQRMRDEDIEIMVAQDYADGDEPEEMPMSDMYDTISNHRHFDGLVRGALENVNEIILGYDLRTTRRGPVQDISEIVISIRDSQGTPREVGRIEDQQLIESLISTGEVNTSYINQQETMTYGDVLTFENVVTDPRRNVTLHRLNGNPPSDLVSGVSGSDGVSDEVNRQILEEVLDAWRSRSG
ncbi:MAG: hypothetical protein ACQETP_00495 [Bacteroidota bacterium]